ncbi:MAG TPA: IF-2-associated domain-containing protein, partial [Caulobacteraceae bacterium]|nr:IF-2-associated domain-containing protein [Caulobacteraceae bacterium]
MSDANDDNNNRAGGGRAPLTLKPRPGAVSAGTVKQSFSHGRSKTVVVETKRRRVDAPASAGGLGGPSAAEKRAALDVRPRETPAATTPRPAVAASPSLNLSAEELQARQRAIEAARIAAERREADTVKEQATRAAEETRRREAEAAAAKPATPVAEAAAPAPAA